MPFELVTKPLKYNQKELEYFSQYPLKIGYSRAKECKMYSIKKQYVL